MQQVNKLKMDPAVIAAFVDVMKIDVEAIYKKRKLENRNRKKRVWTRKWIDRHMALGGEVLLRELSHEDPISYTNVLCMTPARFDELLHMIEGSIQKQNTFSR